MAKKSKLIPKEFKRKCHAIIHTATIAAGAAGLIPIPVADTIPITSAQVTMIVALGKVFDLTISESIAKSIISAGFAQASGRSIVSGAFKFIPGLGSLAGMAIGSITAVTLTETIGWLVAEDFYKLYLGETPDGIIDGLDSIRTGQLFSAIKRHY